MQKLFIKQHKPSTTLAIGFFTLLVLGLLNASVSNMMASGQSVIQLSAKLVGSDFKWVNNSDGKTNPTLMLKANMAQTIRVQNPTQTVHQLVIDLNGKQVATSGNIAPGSSGQVSFTPNQAGTGMYTYHCFYHPTTMKGIIQVQ